MANAKWLWVAVGINLIGTAALLFLVAQLRAEMREGFSRNITRPPQPAISNDGPFRGTVPPPGTVAPR